MQPVWNPQFVPLTELTAKKIYLTSASDLRKMNNLPGQLHHGLMGITELGITDRRMFAKVWKQSLTKRKGQLQTKTLQPGSLSHALFSLNGITGYIGMGLSPKDAAEKIGQFLPTVANQIRSNEDRAFVHSWAQQKIASLNQWHAKLAPSTPVVTQTPVVTENLVTTSQKQTFRSRLTSFGRRILGRR